jgi:hypothetical protein
MNFSVLSLSCLLVCPNLKANVSRNLSIRQREKRANVHSSVVSKSFGRVEANLVRVPWSENGWGRAKMPVKIGMWCFFLFSQGIQNEMGLV